MTAVVLVAAGSGQRLGADVPKALVTVMGETLIAHCINVIDRVAHVDEVVVVVPEAYVEEVAGSLAGRPVISVVAGADTREGSVRAGLAGLQQSHEHVLIHDAARPFAPAEVYQRVIGALESGAVAVVPAVPVTDTIKRAHDGQVLQTLDRSELVAVQTPQGFALGALRDAHASADAVSVTDDAMLLEAAGTPVQVVEGSDMAFKITTVFDLRMAEVLQERS